MLKFIGKVVALDDLLTIIAINAGVLLNLNDIITNGDKKIIKPACFALSIITAGLDDNI